MEVIAKSNYVRSSPRKLRLIADLLRGRNVSEAENILKNLPKKGAELLLAVLRQGTGNAANNFRLPANLLYIKKLEIGDGPRLKRTRFVSRGRVHRISKRTSNIRLVLEAPEQAKPKSEIINPKQIKNSKS